MFVKNKNSIYYLSQKVLLIGSNWEWNVGICTNYKTVAHHLSLYRSFNNWFQSNLFSGKSPRDQDENKKPDDIFRYTVHNN